MDGASNGQSARPATADEGRRVELPGELYATMRELAGEHQRSIAGEVRYALGLYVRQAQRRQASAA